MKRVLLVNTVSTSFNGVTSVIMNYVRKTNKMVQYDFVLCNKVEQRFADELKRLGGNVFIPPCSRVKAPLSYSAWLRKIMKEQKYDVIHVHGNSGTMYFEVHAAKRLKIPVRVAHSHNTSCKFMTVNRVLKPLLNRELTHALACSDAAGKWLFTGDYTVLPNGIDVEKFAFSRDARNEYRKQLGVEDKFVIGHVGHMNVQKNQLFLLRVMEQLVKRQPNARLLLVGDGKLRPEIEEFIRQYQLQDCVRLLGKRSDVMQLYQCMDVFTLPSVYEGLGVVLIEAQTAGLPCVASVEVPQSANALGLVKYIGIEDSDIELWCDAITEAYGSVPDRAGCYDRMKESIFNIDSCVDILLKTYQS